MIPVCEPVLDGNEERYVLDCLRSGWISSAGRYVEAFETSFAAACGVRYGVSTTSGTTALHLALVSLGIGPGDEVICPDFNLIAGTNMVILAGARPVLVDAHPKTWCIDPDLIEEKITPRTKAIMAVHMYGHPCDMQPILDVAERNDLYVIEDGAEAHGAEYNGRPVGGLGDVACFSFYGNKVLTTGEGGMVVTQQDWIAAQAAKLRNQAFGGQRFRHEEFGFNYRLSNVLAAIGLAQVEKLPEKVEQKRRIARQYGERLQGVPGLRLPVEQAGCKSVHWMYGVVVEEAFGRTRDEVRRQLADGGVETRDFFHPIHQQPVYRRGSDARYPRLTGEFPVSEELGRRGLYLPSGLGLTDAQIAEVAEKLLACRGSEVLQHGVGHPGHL